MSDSISRRIRNDRAGGARNDDRQPGKVQPPHMSGLGTATRKPAVEMTPYGNPRTVSTGTWKSRTEREIPTFPQAILIFL